MSIPSFAGSETPNLILLTPTNTVNMRGAIDFDSVTNAQLELARQVAVRGKKNYKIYLIMDSPGGMIEAGEDFIQFARRIPNVDTVSLFAASMASAIVEALPGKRYALDNSVLMFHRAKGGFKGQFETGEVESQLALAKTMVKHMEQRNADRLKLTLEEYKSLVVNEYWAHGVDIKTQGMVDEITELECSPALVNTRVRMLIGGLFDSATLTFSGCPLIRSPLPEQNKKDNPQEDEE